VQPIPHLLSELIRAANTTAKLSEFSRARLLDRASDKIRILRLQKGRHIEVGGDDIAFNAFMMARSVPRYSDDEISHALLDAAGAIWSLHIDPSEKAH